MAPSCQMTNLRGLHLPGLAVPDQVVSDGEFAGDRRLVAHRTSR
jgi:hypothetical protein